MAPPPSVTAVSTVTLVPHSPQNMAPATKGSSHEGQGSAWAGARMALASSGAVIVAISSICSDAVSLASVASAVVVPPRPPRLPDERSREKSVRGAPLFFDRAMGSIRSRTRVVG